ncbi:MAG: quinone oxidoreductase [Acidobacteria bacterium]|nr:quinone oxidoreductase [Acidobacteriota bacterium]
MVTQIQISEVGGPEVMTTVAVELAQPGPGEVLIRHTAIGLNYIDTYHRTGLYPVDLPSGLGIEAAGVVESVGPDVSEVSPGVRVVYAGGPVGSYSQARVMPAAPLVPLPDDIEDVQAAAMMIKGLTAQYLLRQTFVVKPGVTVLVHAAAGGVGLLLCQWAAHLGATVIGTVGSDQKAELARAHGCHHVIVYTREVFAERVRELTAGKGVPVVYDSVGKATWEGSLDCLAPRGLMVSYGNASGPVPAFEPGVLALKGSLFVTRPTLFSYAATRVELLAMADDLFDVVRSGAVKVAIRQTYPLAEAADAHRALEARETTGSTVLLP